MPNPSVVSFLANKNPLAVVLLDTKWNRVSVNALVGAIETATEWDAVEIRWPANESRLDSDLADLRAQGKRTIVGLSFPTAQVPRMRKIIARSSPFSDSTLWIAGGPHPTADPEGTLHLGFNAVVCGEGETTILDIFRAVVDGTDLTSVPGLAMADEAGKIIFSGRRKPVDLDAFPPFPLRRRRIVGPIEIVRGCPFGCAFCQTSHLLGPRPRYRSVETIARYASVIRQRGLRDVRFVAPNAFSYGSPDGKTLNLAALESLLTTLQPVMGREGRLFFGTFPSEVRPEHVTDETLALVKRFAANDSLIIGAQSGSDRMLAHCRRGHCVADILSAASRTIAVGLRPHVDFIFGLPGEMAEDLDATIKTINELVAMGALIHAHTFMPLPQTRFADEPPGIISGRLRMLIRELIRDDHLYGVWHQQLRLNRQV